ncbi:intradiol ring-cleavage dioxygenase [Planctomycetales bacterium ZRK34]|nr:intradiol ring-cleavage dioxygenase [Planctomycetales bacterium ZRK34]
MQNRRQFIGRMGFGLWACATVPTFAEQLIITPAQTEGPFYPDKLPLDQDNDLVIVDDSTSPAVGQITHLSGRVLTKSGSPVRGATVEIWQVDGKGVYLHSRDRAHDKRDTHFQGYGRFETAAGGDYRFRTIKPVPYASGAFRTPHIHVIVRKGDRKLLTTQMYIKGHPMNQRDGIYRRIRDADQRDNVTIDFKPIPDSKLNELAAEFNIVLGHTPADD